MTEHKNIYAALAAAQGEFGPIFKDATNPHFKNRYATLSAILEGVRPVLSKHGIALVQRAITISNERFAIETILAHGASDTEITSETPMLLGRFDQQQFGSSMTYAKRYSLMAVLGIAAEDDDDDGNAAVQAAPTKTASTPAFKAATAAHMKRELENLEHDLADTYTEVALESLWRSWAAKMNKEAWPTAEPDDETAYRNQVIFRFRDRKAEIQEKAEVAAEPVRNPLMAG
jgi:hypothetical protein